MPPHTAMTTEQCEFAVLVACDIGLHDYHSEAVQRYEDSWGPLDCSPINTELTELNSLAMDHLPRPSPEYGVFVHAEHMPGRDLICRGFYTERAAQDWVTEHNHDGEMFVAEIPGPSTTE